MRSVTVLTAGPRARSALVSAVALALLAGAAGCDAGDDIGGRREGGSSSGAAAEEPGAPEVATVTTLQHVGKALGEAQRARVKAAVTSVVDPWFDGAYLGDFPRTDFSAAFSTFTQGAAADAQRTLDVMSNAAVSDQLETATATRRRVTVDVFTWKGRPRGATAHVLLDFDTTGQLAGSMRVRGELYLTRVEGAWKVFGYDVDQAVPR